MLSSPKTVVDILKSTGATKQVSSFIENNFPQLSEAANTTGQSIAVTAEILSVAGEGVEEALGYFANSEETQILHEKVSKAYDDNSGAVDVAIAMATTVATNPEAIPEIVAQSLPTMLALAKEGSVFAATFTAMVGQRIDDATQVYKDTHGGQLPQDADYNTIAIGAVVATAIETLESRFLLSKHAKVANASASKEARLLGVPGVSTAVRGVEGAGAEAFQEGSAEYITQLTGQGDVSIDAALSDVVVKPAAVAGAIGAGPGAAIKGGAQVLPDIGKTAKTGIQAVSAGVEKAVTVNTEKRLKKAQESGDNLAVVEIGLEKDITQLEDAETRKKFILHMFDRIDAAHDQHDEMSEGADKTKFKAGIDKATIQLNAVIAATNNINKAEQEQATTLQAEQVLRGEEVTVEEIVSAMETIASDLQKGAQVQDSTIKSIMGSSHFDELSDTLQETVNLYEKATAAAKTAQETGSDKTLEAVAQDIQYGNPKERFIGTEQHKTTVGNAIQLGDPTRANKSLQQLVALRETMLKKLANPSINSKTKEVYGTGAHTPKFVKQLTAEIKSIDATIQLLDSNVKAAFGESSLTTKETTSPEIQVYGGAATSTPASTDTKKTTKPKPQKKEIPKSEPELEVETVPKAAPGKDITDSEIPKKSKYTSDKVKQKIKIGKRSFNKTYKSVIIELDNVLRAVQRIVRECNV